MNEVAQYVSDRFDIRRRDSNDIAPPPVSMSITLLADCERAANLLAQAFQNPSMNIILFYFISSPLIPQQWKPPGTSWPIRNGKPPDPTVKIRQWRRI